MSVYDGMKGQVVNLRISYRVSTSFMPTRHWSAWAKQPAHKNLSTWWPQATFQSLKWFWLLSCYYRPLVLYSN